MILKVKGFTYPSSPSDSLPKQTIIMEVRFKTPVTLAKSLPPFKSITVSKVWMFQFRWHATILVEGKKYFVTQTTEGFDVTENGKPKTPIYQGNGKDFQKWITYLAANTRR